MKRIVTVSILLCLLLGCGGSANQRGGELSGTITYKSQPVNGCTLILVPTSTDLSELPVPVTQEGTFHTTSVPPGDYKIVVRPSKGPPAGPNLEGKSPEKAAEMREKLAAMKSGPPTIPIPEKYEDKKQTDLKCTVTTGEQKLTLELKD